MNQSMIMSQIQLLSHSIVVLDYYGRGGFPSMSSDKKPIAVVLVDFNYEDQEFHYPRYRLIEAGYHVLSVGKEKMEYKVLDACTC
jgi:hypothetical protein